MKAGARKAANSNRARRLAPPVVRLRNGGVRGIKAILRLDGMFRCGRDLAPSIEALCRKIVRRGGADCPLILRGSDGTGLFVESIHRVGAKPGPAVVRGRDGRARKRKP